MESNANKAMWNENSNAVFGLEGRILPAFLPCKKSNHTLQTIMNVINVHYFHDIMRSLNCLLSRLVCAWDDHGKLN